MKTVKFTTMFWRGCVLATVFGLVGSASAQTMTEAWVRHEGFGIATAVAVGTNGILFVTGSSTTIAYSQEGVPLWTNGFSSTTGAAKAIAVGSNGTVFVTGYSHGGSSNNNDYATIAYSQEGVPLWTNRYGGFVFGDDRATALAVGTNGNVFVTGTCATIAYSQEGVPLWTNGYSNFGAAAIAVSANGRVFVAGVSRETDTWNDWATIAYSQEGVPLWTNRYDGPGNDSFGDIGDQPTAMAVDADGTVVVTGFTAFFTNQYNPDYATIAYSQDGVPLWTNRYSSPNSNGDDRATAVAIGTDGTAVVTGYSAATGGPDYVTIAYSHEGMPLWTNRYNGPGNNHDGASAVAVGSDGTVFVTGTSYGNGSSGDFATIVYSAAGVPLCTNRYNRPSNYYDDVGSLAIVPDGVVVAGSSIVSRFGRDFLIVKYSTTPLPPEYNTVSGQLLDDGAMRLLYVGQPSMGYALDRTANLAPPDWIPQTTNLAGAGGVLIFTNAPDPTTNNFWRVRSVP